MEQVLTKSDRDRLYALDCLSQIVYFAFINEQYIDIVLKKLPKGGLWDTAFYYREQQTAWKYKILKALRDYGKISGVDIRQGLIDDLNETPIMAMFDIIGDLKSARDMEGIADVVKELRDLKNIDSIKTNLIALIRNEKNKQQ